MLYNSNNFQVRLDQQNWTFEVTLNIVSIMVFRNSGLYCIIVTLGTKRRIKVGELGIFTFTPGTYLYVGSAKKGLSARVARHKKRLKPLRWHIDYLRSYSRWFGATMYNGLINECMLVDKIKTLINGKIPVVSFGSSDCRCSGHLIQTRLSAEKIIQLLQSIKTATNA